MKYLLFILAGVFFLNCGNDDDGAVNPPPVDLGPLEAAANNNLSWTWIAHNDMFSRNGNTTGYLANLNENSDKLVIYLQGGGACYNALTCDGNREAYTNAEGENGANVLNNGFFTFLSRSNASSPVAGWNWLFVPYSTGDLHSGTNPDGDVPFGGPQDQNMQGSENMNIILEDLQQFFPSFSEILVTGSSAGGYGMYLTFPKVAEAFPQAQMTGLSDAGPIFPTNTATDQCLGQQWESLFQFDYPADYSTLVTGTYGYAYQGAYEYLAKKYPQHNFGLLADYEDSVLRYFYGFDANNCDGSTEQVPPETFETATREIQNLLVGYENWKVFFIDSDGHTFLGGRYAIATINNTVMTDWIVDLTNGEAEDLME